MPRTAGLFITICILMSNCRAQFPVKDGTRPALNISFKVLKAQDVVLLLFAVVQIAWMVCCCCCVFRNNKPTSRAGESGRGHGTERARETGRSRETWRSTWNQFWFASSGWMGSESRRTLDVVLDEVTLTPLQPQPPPVAESALVEDLQFVVRNLDDDESLCPICLDHFTPNIDTAVLPCMHSLHLVCLIQCAAMSTGTNCPVCRADVRRHKW